MKDEILAHIDNPGMLEKMYRTNRSAFKRDFNSLYHVIKGNVVAELWNERLNYDGDNLSRGSKIEIVWIIMASLIAGIIAKIPAIFSIDEELFYSRNIGFIIFPILIIYFARKNKLSLFKCGAIGCALLLALVFINLLPRNANSDTLVLSGIHLQLFLWSLTGFAFAGEQSHNYEKRINYLKFNGDLVVITTLILIAGAILSGLTVGLFSLIGLHIESFYFEYVGVFGLAAAPIVGTYLTQTNPQLVGRVSPVIARIFSPLVLIMLVTYLVAITFSGKDPYTDRDFLMIFNGLLIGVMALIFFSISESSGPARSKSELIVLLLLSIVTVVVNCIALSAILFRISEWGITPNRAAVMGGNILILINLQLVTLKLFKHVFNKESITKVRHAIASYLPVYVIWTIIVTFLFPFIFGFK